MGIEHSIKSQKGALGKYHGLKVLSEPLWWELEANNQTPMTPLSPLAPLSDPRHQLEGHSPSQWGGGVSFVSNFFVPIAVYITSLWTHFHFDRFVFVSKLTNASFFRFLQHNRTRTVVWGPVLESAEAWRQRLQAPSSFAGSETNLAWYFCLKPDSRDCILFNTVTCRIHLIFGRHCESLMWECSESKSLTKEAGFGTFHRPKSLLTLSEPAKACYRRQPVQLGHGSENEPISHLIWDVPCCACLFSAFLFYLSVFQTFVNKTLCPHIGSFNTLEWRSIKDSINLPK